MAPVSSQHFHAFITVECGRDQFHLLPIQGKYTNVFLTYTTAHESCDDLTSFFEMAGGLYFDPKTGPPDETLTSDGASAGGEGVDAFHAENEALTRVMAGLL